MSNDNSSRDWSSWNTKGANKDTQHWQPKTQQALQQHFSDYSNLHILHQLSQDEPQVFAEIMRDNPNDPAAAVQSLAKLNQAKSDELRVKAGIKKPTPKRRNGWDDDGKTNDAVRAILRQR